MTGASERANDDGFPRWVWHVVVGGCALVVVVVGAAVLLIALGAADPPVAGRVVWSDDGFAWVDGSAALIASGTGQWWTAPSLLPVDGGMFTLSVEALLRPGDLLAAWGVWVANDDGTRTLYALNASGYWTIRICPPDAAIPIEECPAPSPEWRWLAFPRIRPAGSTNTITLHREGGDTLRLRMNGERLGAPIVRTGGDWGVWARGVQGELVVEWRAASLSTTP